MKIYKTQAEVEADIKNGVLLIKGAVKFECSIAVDAHIIVPAGNIIARNIIAWNIIAGGITAKNITARNIVAEDITAWNVTAWNIIARNISAEDISAVDIIASNIIAEDISFYAFCTVYDSIKYSSIEGRRKKHLQTIYFDGKLTITEEEIEEMTMEEVCKALGKTIKIKK